MQAPLYLSLSVFFFVTMHFQRISILPSQKGLEFAERWGPLRQNIKRHVYMYIVLSLITCRMCRQVGVLEKKNCSEVGEEI